MKLLRFHASWCGPCKRFEPILAAFADKHGIPVVSVDVEEQSDLATAYDVTSVPTTVVVQGGEVVKTLHGAMPSPVLSSALSDFL